MAGWIARVSCDSNRTSSMDMRSEHKKGRAFSLFAAIVMPLSLVIAWLIYTYVLGDPGNFVGGDPEKEPLQGNYLGTIHKGGPIVVLLIAFQVVLVAYIVERFLSIRRAAGRGGNHDFVLTVRDLIAEDRTDDAVKACDEQQGRTRRSRSCASSSESWA